MLTNREKLVPGMRLRLLILEELTALENEGLIVRQEQIRGWPPIDGWLSADEPAGYAFSREMLQECASTVWTVDEDDQEVRWQACAV